MEDLKIERLTIKYKETSINYQQYEDYYDLLRFKHNKKYPIDWVRIYKTDFYIKMNTDFLFDYFNELIDNVIFGRLLGEVYYCGGAFSTSKIRKIQEDFNCLDWRFHAFEEEENED